MKPVALTAFRTVFAVYGVSNAPSGVTFFWFWPLRNPMTDA